MEYGAGSKHGLHAQLTWFDIDYRDRIVSPASAITTIFTNSAVYAPIVNRTPDPAVVAAYFASPYFVALSTIPASGVAAIVDARTQNLASQRMRGLDFDLGYRFSLAGGEGEFGTGGSYIASFRQQITQAAPSLDIVDTIGNPPDLRVRGRARWSRSGFGAAAFVNYTDSYRNTSRNPVTKVGSWTTVDLQISYHIDNAGPLGGGLTLALSATNLFDRDPPRTAYLLSSRTVGYDVENASPLGRMLSFLVTTKW